ncbi:hypothetical protein KIN20_034403 [Parelaphostrongylus tenuis]|uniref:Uncharacterized protein n=1 Tax=Parelaphostrongylus tenuis TaxID=148309 RepID=A0AAD5RA32_PARTN|nr:hypothetical protein KIN20_034403 [Parelaphostrongylus tenuis]
MYVTCKRLTEHIAQIIRKATGNMWGKKFRLKMDGCSLGGNALRSFFTHISPFALHLAGEFDRSIISDQVLPSSTLFSLFIEGNKFDLETCTRISVISLRKILDNWFQRYSDNPSIRPIEDYEHKDFLIEIPDCVMDYSDFIELFKELTRCPHRTLERIYIHKVPKTLILAIARNLSTFDQWLRAWIQEGMCSRNDIIWRRYLSCDCHGMNAADLPSDASQLCDGIRLYSLVSVDSPRNPEQLLDFVIMLSAK